MPDFARARCRLIPDFCVAAIVCLTMLALTFGFALTQPPHNLESWTAGAAMLALWGATPFYWLVARWRGVVEFDPKGARWRAAFGVWKSARWDEIESCDARMTSTGGSVARWKFVVQTRNGAFSWTESFEQAEQLAPFAARFCPQIAADSANWSRRFSYRSGENLFVGFVVLFLTGCISAILCALVGARRVSEIGPQIEVYVALYGWTLTLAGFALFGALVLGVPTIFLLIYAAMLRQSWRRRAEILTATASGLSWRVGANERVFARWDELQTLHIEARGLFIALPFYRLQTARGEMNWGKMLCGNAQLSQTLFERAPQLKRVVTPQLREELNENLRGSGEVVEFDFKSRTLRAVLCSGTFFSLFLWGVTILGPLQPANGSEPAPTWLSGIFAIIATIFTLCGAQLFRRGCIRLDARGIEWKVPSRSQFVAWQEIDALILDKKYWLRLGSQNGARRVALATYDIYPAHLERLLELIAERAVSAGGAWKVAGKIARTETDE